MKQKILNFMIVVLVIAIIVVVFLIILKYGGNQVNEKKLADVVKDFKMTEISEEIQENTNQTDILEESNSFEEAKIKNIEIEGYKVIGLIKIDKINLEYPILEETTNKTMKLSITKFWGNELNEIGNVTLAGHNNKDGTMFGKTKNLQKSDIIEITDLKNNTVKYEIFDMYIIYPDDTSCVNSVDPNSREITLITCSNGNKQRLIIKAREVKYKEGQNVR